MIRDCTKADLPKLVPLLRSLNALHAHHLSDRFHTDAAAQELLQFFQTRHSEGARLLAYFTEGVPRGYVMWLVETRDATCLTRARRRAVLDHIYVEPGWRRRGIGGRLIARFETACVHADCPEWISRVYAFNTASMGLMQSAGATEGLQMFKKPLP